MKELLEGFLPSKYSLLIFSTFYALGFIFAWWDPFRSQELFVGGFLYGDIEAKFLIPNHLSLDYLVSQLILFLGRISLNIFLNNFLVSLQCIFFGFFIISSLLIGLFSFLGSVSYTLIAKVGLIKASLMLLGSFHLFFECLAAMLVIDAFYLFYRSVFRVVRARSSEPFKNAMKKDFIPLMLRITILLGIGAFLEVFWSTWWVYILNNPYISWSDFYLGVYYCMPK